MINLIKIFQEPRLGINSDKSGVLNLKLYYFLDLHDFYSQRQI